MTSLSLDPQVAADGGDPARRLVRTLGVLGGMGPLATAHFYRRVVEATPATADQAHIPTVVWSDPRVPDRTAAIQARGPSPVPALRRGVSALAFAGADVIAIPCNTAHAFLPDLRVASALPFIDMIRETLLVALAECPGIERLGVLGTSGTRLAQLYEGAAEQVGLSIVHVPWDLQSTLVEEAIGIVKGGGDSGRAERLVEDAAASLARQGADACVAACTELPLVSGRAASVLPVIDSLECLARAVVRHCMPTRVAPPSGTVVVSQADSPSAAVEWTLEQPGHDDDRA